MVTITCFHNNRRFDLDNILKPILDAMNELIYEDDKQITDLHSHKRDLSADLEARNSSSVLSEALARPTPFVHIIVDHAPDLGVDTLTEDIAILERKFVSTRRRRSTAAEAMK